MSQRNVPISLLLGGGEENAKQEYQYANQSQTPAPHMGSQSPQPLNSASPYRPNPILSLVSDFQAQGELRPNLAQKPIVIDDERSSPPEIVVVDDNDRALRLPVPLAPSYRRPSPLAFKVNTTGDNPGAVLDYIKNFQSNFKVGSTEPIDSSTIQWRAGGPSKTSINSIINSEESNALLAPAPEKKKRASSTKTDSAAKKAKTEKKTAKGDVKAEPKKPGPKSKKKTPEIAIAPADKPSIHPTATADKAKTKSQPVKLEKPAVLSLKKEDQLDDSKSSPHEDKKDKLAAPPPIIALNIPLLDPKAPMPGQAEVVVNVLKLAEEKYGWNTIHPNAKSAIDLMDEMLDDEDEGADEDDDDELQVVDEKGNTLAQNEKNNAQNEKSNAQSKKKNNDELTEEQRARQHETRMNRKVGKYDYEDPFIDDEELQWEEEITTTKEGFFVYWGPLVEDRAATSTTKKGTAKGKK